MTTFRLGGAPSIVAKCIGDVSSTDSAAEYHAVYATTFHLVFRNTFFVNEVLAIIFTLTGDHTS